MLFQKHLKKKEGEGKEWERGKEDGKKRISSCPYNYYLQCALSLLETN